MAVESAVGIIMKLAVDLDAKERYTEALVYYRKGLQVLDEKMSGESDENNKNYIRDKIEEYTKRVNAIEELVEKQKKDGNYREKVHIEEDSTGHGYKALFGRFLDEAVEDVVVEDRFIRTFHQCQNFLWLCELLVKSCDNLRRIKLLTCKDAESEANQKDWFYNLKTDLQKYGVQLTIIYCDNRLSLRKIILSSGWMIDISRGLDMYKVPDNNFCLGVCDLDLRQCHKTSVYIMHSNNILVFDRSHSDGQRATTSRPQGARPSHKTRYWTAESANHSKNSVVNWRIRPSPAFKPKPRL